jgi:hypothetical protein
VDNPKLEQIGPPWFDEAWIYRSPVIISNSGTSLAYYQVLVTLNNSNFDFSLAKVDGSDVRITHSDGTTELKYWIESWDYGKKLAYIWIRVPSLGVGDTAIYIYYNNPNATSTSDGTTTFDGFDDDWSQFTGAGFIQGETQNHQSSEVESLFSWSSIAALPTVSSGILNLVDGTGIKSNSTYQYNVIGMRANFGLGTGREWGGFINTPTGQRAIIGELPSDPSNLYLINYRNSQDNYLLPRVNGVDWHNTFHVYEVRWNSNQSIGDIDHSASIVLSTQPLQVPNISLPVTLYSYPGSNATLQVDWVYLRQYRNPEPTVSVMIKQGLVDLGISMIDAPDPLPKSEELTYQITIANNSIIAAPGVTVTDTLPTSAQLSKVDPSQGNCTGSTEIVCNLGLILANSTASISVSVIPTVDGVITNTAIVGSLGFDLYMGNNVDEAGTLVDSIPPNVNWENPVRNGQSFTSYGGLVSLVASATDNDQVAWVEFWLWDHLPTADPKGKISIGIDNIYPYQVQFNSDILVPNQTYQMFVQAADRADNVSSIYTAPHPVIYIERFLLYFINIPIAIK